MSGSGGTRPPPGTMPLRQAPPQNDRRDGTARSRAGDRPTAPGHRSRPRLTGRGAVLLMFVVFGVGNLTGAGLQAWWLAGVSYAAGCLLAVGYARRDTLLLVVTTPPLIYLGTLVIAELVTAQGGTVLATAEGTLLALAAVSPWLVASTAGCLIVALMRGLRQSIRHLSAELDGRAEQPGR
jgi:hypothetical protein